MAARRLPNPVSKRLRRHFPTTMSTLDIATSFSNETETTNESALDLAASYRLLSRVVQENIKNLEEAVYQFPDQLKQLQDSISSFTASNLRTLVTSIESGFPVAMSELENLSDSVSSVQEAILKSGQEVSVSASDIAAVYRQAITNPSRTLEERRSLLGEFRSYFSQNIELLNSMRESLISGTGLTQEQFEEIQASVQSLVAIDLDSFNFTRQQTSSLNTILGRIENNSKPHRMTTTLANLNDTLEELNGNIERGQEGGLGGRFADAFKHAWNAKVGTPGDMLSELLKTLTGLDAGSSGLFGEVIDSVLGGAGWGAGSAGFKGIMGKLFGKGVAGAGAAAGKGLLSRGAAAATSASGKILTAGAGAGASIAGLTATLSKFLTPKAAGIPGSILFAEPTGDDSIESFPGVPKFDPSMLTGRTIEQPEYSRITNQPIPTSKTPVPPGPRSQFRETKPPSLKEAVAGAPIPTSGALTSSIEHDVDVISRDPVIAGMIYSPRERKFVPVLTSRSYLNEVSRELGPKFGDIFQALSPFQALSTPKAVHQTEDIPRAKGFDDNPKDKRAIQVNMPDPDKIQPFPTDFDFSKYKIGDITAGQESGDPGAVNDDISPVTGKKYGKSFGAFQLNRGNAPAMIRDNPEFKEKYFKGIDIGPEAWKNKEFQDAWKTAGKEEPEKFYEAQRGFMLKSHLSPLASNIKDKYGLDISQRSPAVQEALFSAATHRGPGKAGAFGVFQKAVGGDDPNTLSDQELVARIYKARESMFPGYSKRYNDEKAQITQMAASMPSSEPLAGQPRATFEPLEVASVVTPSSSTPDYASHEKVIEDQRRGREVALNPEPKQAFQPTPMPVVTSPPSQSVSYVPSLDDADMLMLFFAQPRGV